MFSKLVPLSLVLCLSACATTNQPISTASSPVISSPIQTDYRSHVVTKGETLWRICKSYDADIDEVVRINNIPESSNISVGQKLLIPKQKTPANINFAAKDNMDFLWPANGQIVGRFRERLNGVQNKGIDIATAPGQDIYASRDGLVAFAGRLNGYGETLIIDHRDGISTVYCGNSSLNVKSGDEVKRGTAIAKAGQSARDGKTALHFEIRRKNKPQNPLYYLN